MYEDGKYSYAEYLGGNKYKIYLRRNGPGTELLGIYDGYLSKCGNIMKCYCRSPAQGVWWRMIPGKIEVPVCKMYREPSYV